MVTDPTRERTRTPTIAFATVIPAFLIWFGTLWWLFAHNITVLAAITTFAILIAVLAGVISANLGSDAVPFAISTTLALPSLTALAAGCFIAGNVLAGLAVIAAVLVYATVVLVLGIINT